jgi:protein involved in polysaccharide export with SLBB domain
MTRIFLFLVFQMTLVSCIPYESTIQDEGETIFSSTNEESLEISNEVLFKEDQKESIDKISSNTVNDKKYHSFAEYLISPGDQLDIFLSIKSKLIYADYEVAIGDTIIVNFLNAPKFDEAYEIGLDGQITLPIIGKYEVAGNTVLNIKNDLVLIYSKIFKRPDVMVLIPDYLNKIHQLKLELRAVSKGLRRSVTVDAKGYIFLPIIGEINVNAKTIAQVSKDLNLEYSKINSSLQAHLFLN